MKEYCSNCRSLTEGIDHFNCDVEGRVISREVSCSLCFNINIVEYYAKPIPKFYSMRLLQGKSIRPSILELPKEAYLKVHYTGRCITCGKKYTYDFDNNNIRPLSIEPLCFCSLECLELYGKETREVKELFESEGLRRLLIGDQSCCFLCGKTFQEIQVDKVRLDLDYSNW